MRIAAVSHVGLLLGSLAVAAAPPGSRAAPLERHVAGADAVGRKAPAAESVKVAGKVVDRSDGTPLAQAQVTLDGPKKGTAWTDADGRFEFEGPIGDYTITVKAGGKSQTFPAKITKTGLEPDQLEFDKE